MTTIQYWVEVPLVLLSILGTLLAFIERMKSGRGVGARFIQTLVTIIVLPLIGVLALEGKITGEGLGTLLGVIVGYTLPGVLKRVPSSKTPGLPPEEDSVSDIG